MLGLDLLEGLECDLVALPAVAGRVQAIALVVLIQESYAAALELERSLQELVFPVMSERRLDLAVLRLRLVHFWVVGL